MTNISFSNDNERLLKRAEVAQLLRVCTRSVVEYERRGLLRALRINRRMIRYPASEVARFLQSAENRDDDCSGTTL